MSVQNDPRFLSPMGSRLARIGLEPKDAALGRYIEIDLRTPRPEPEEFAEYGEFDTFTVLNSSEIPRGAKVWLYFNLKSPEYRLPLQDVRIIDTIADRFYLQHDEPIDATLRIIIGGDLRAMNVVPKEQGSSDITGTVDITDRATRKLGEVSLPGVATEAKLEQVRQLVEALTNKDFATQTTLALILAELQTQTQLLTDIKTNTTPGP